MSRFGGCKAVLSGNTFSEYVSRQMSSDDKSQAVLKLVNRLTVGIKDTYKTCNPNFAIATTRIPLTKPSEGVSNDGHDNVNSDLILRVNATIINPGNMRRYKISEMLGQGTFGQVVKCWDYFTQEFVAIKVIKNQVAYYRQARVEVKILEKLKNECDPDDSHHIVRKMDHFVFQNHLCIVFELLNANLFELIKQNNFRGLSLTVVRLFTKQILEALIVLQDAGIIHCDLKPENILLKSVLGEIKLIDFGSACEEHSTVYSYIQSRFYRSPEVLLGYKYTTAIDLWSLGCVCAELFIGLPLFPGLSEYDLMYRMMDTLGAQPPEYILKESKEADRFFKLNPFTPGGQSSSAAAAAASSFSFLTPAEYEEKTKVKPIFSKRYFKQTLLDDIIWMYASKKGFSKKDFVARSSFIHFLRGLLAFDPRKRWTAKQAYAHPFITDEVFTGSWEPPHDPKMGERVASASLPASRSGTPDNSDKQLKKRGTAQGIGSWDPQYNPTQHHPLSHPLQQPIPGCSEAPMAVPYGAAYVPTYGSYNGTFMAEPPLPFFAFTPPQYGALNPHPSSYGVPSHMAPHQHQQLHLIRGGHPGMSVGPLSQSVGPPSLGVSPPRAVGLDRQAGSRGGRKEASPPPHSSTPPGLDHSSMDADVGGDEGQLAANGGSAEDGPLSPIPNPGDWDPGYSDDLLLDEDHRMEASGPLSKDQEGGTEDSHGSQRHSSSNGSQKLASASGSGPTMNPAAATFEAQSSYDHSASLAAYNAQQMQIHFQQQLQAQLLYHQQQQQQQWMTPPSGQLSGSYPLPMHAQGMAEQGQHRLRRASQSGDHSHFAVSPGFSSWGHVPGGSVGYPVAGTSLPRGQRSSQSGASSVNGRLPPVSPLRRDRQM